MQTNRVCKTCGKSYFYCSHCDEPTNSPEWMLMWDTKNCKMIFEIVSAYVQRQINKSTAKERLEKCDLRQLYTFKESVRKVIEEILTEDKKDVSLANEIEKPNQRNIPKSPRRRKN